MLKGHKRSFVVVDLDLVGVESKAKMFLVEQNFLLMEQQMFANENRVQSDIIIA